MNRICLNTTVCTICFRDDLHTIKCASKSCTAHICDECFLVYLNYCIAEKSLVVCVNKHCKSYITSSSFKDNNNYYDIYKKAIVTAFLHSRGPDVKNILLIDNIINNMRADRKKFIKIFPKAINLVVKIALSKKLENINKQNKDCVINLISGLNRICIISHCNGKLNHNFECLKCDTKFCKNCEKIIKLDHVCLISDVESLKFLSNVRKCPKCYIPIEKSEGCNNMTCASCNINFNYSTGELSIEGSTNVPVLSRKSKVHFGFKTKYSSDIGRMLFRIENREPREPSETLLIGIIKKLLINENNLEITNDTIKIFEKYIKNKNEYINYTNIILDINEHHLKGEINTEYLEDIMITMRE